MRLLTFILLILVVAAVSVSGYLFFTQQQAPVTNPVTETIPTVADLYTERSGNTFLLADNTLRRGRSFFTTARTLFEQSISEAQTIEQAAHIKYKIALTYTHEDPKKAIVLMKELVENQQYPPQQKAYALQHMFRMYAYIHYDSALIPEIFSGDPYSSFFNPDDIPLSFKNFHQYTVSFGSAPISEAALAIWYARELNNDSIVLSETLKAEYLSKTKQLLTSIDAYTQGNAEDINNKDLLPITRSIKADIYANLALANVDDYRNKYGDEYVAVIAQSVVDNAAGSAPRQKYAYFSLLMNDSAEWERARPLFDELIDNIDVYSGMKKVYIDASKDLNTRKAEFVFVANKYQKFKDLLIGLGWKESDFTP